MNGRKEVDQFIVYKQVNRKAVECDQGAMCRLGQYELLWATSQWLY